MPATAGNVHASDVSGAPPVEEHTSFPLASYTCRSKSFAGIVHAIFTATSVFAGAAPTVSVYTSQVELVQSELKGLDVTLLITAEQPVLPHQVRFGVVLLIVPEEGVAANAG